MIINVHAGHNPDGKIACGAVGIVKESTEARAIKDLVISKLRVLGHTVYDCTVDSGTSQNDVLKKIVAKCNEHKVDLDISIHLNSGRNDYVGDGSTGGTEVYIYSDSSKAKEFAQNVVNSIASLGYKNRNVKTSTNLYFLRKTNSPSMLIECFFVDDNDDINIYRNVKAEGIATAIVTGIVGKNAMDINNDGKVDANDALDVLKQTVGIKPNTENHNANDALDILKHVVGLDNSNSNTSNNALSTPSNTTSNTNQTNTNTNFTSYKGIVTGDNVNVRNGVGTTSSVIGAVNNGTIVRVYEVVGDWCRIDTNKWISKKYIANLDDSNCAVMATITGSNVNIRTSPNTSSSVVTNLSKGTEVRIWNKENGWYKIDANKYVFEDYVKIKR